MKNLKWWQDKDTIVIPINATNDFLRVDVGAYYASLLTDIHNSSLDQVLEQGDIENGTRE